MGMGRREISGTPNPTAKIAFRVKGVAKATSPKYYPAPAPQGARKNSRPHRRDRAAGGKADFPKSSCGTKLRFRYTLPKKYNPHLPVLGNMGTHQETISAGETVRRTLSDGTRLVEADDGSCSVIEEYDDPDFGTVHERAEYDQYRDARLHFGLWALVGGFDRPERGALQMVPTNIAVAGKPAVAAWLYLKGGYGYVGSRRHVADELGVSEHTVSKYLTQIREVAETS